MRQCSDANKANRKWAAAARVLCSRLNYRIKKCFKVQIIKTLKNQLKAVMLVNLKGKWALQTAALPCRVFRHSSRVASTVYYVVWFLCSCFVDFLTVTCQVWLLYSASLECFESTHHTYISLCVFVLSAPPKMINAFYGHCFGHKTILIFIAICFSGCLFVYSSLDLMHISHKKLYDAKQ